MAYIGILTGNEPETLEAYGSFFNLLAQGAGSQDFGTGA